MLASCHGSEIPKTGSGSLNVAVTNAPAPPPIAEGKVEPVCPAIDHAKLAKLELDTKKISNVPPDVVDDKHVLAHFFTRLAELARGTATDHVRIGVYGDSNMTMDYITGAMRRTLQGRFGDAGHGFVALGRPWPWYLHQDVRHDVDLKGWRMFATSTHQTSDGQYGFANIAAESSTPGATTWVQTASDSAPIGKSVSHFDLYFLKGPARGSLNVKIDGKLEKTISTASTDVEAGFEKFDVPDGPHKLEVTPVGNAKVRVFGSALEREPEGKYSVLVDSLGVGALNFEQMQHVNSKVRVQMLAHRKYDLVVFLLGTNMFAPHLHAKWVNNVLKDFREALPEASLLILSPPDIVLQGSDAHSDPRIVNLAKQMKDIAQKEDTAFWDFREAMGGDASIKKFVKVGLASSDYVHLSHDGGALMGDRLVYSLFTELQKWLPSNENAGCPKAP